jgi:hypothetical protein
MLRAVLTAVYIISGVHIFLGILSVCLGVVSSIRSEVWLAHSVSLEPGFLFTYVVGFFVFSNLGSDVVVRFVNIGGLFQNHYLNFLFIT